MDAQKKMKFKDNLERQPPPSRPGNRPPSRLAFAALLLAFALVTFACSFPYANAAPVPTPLPGIVWWTHTPSPPTEIPAAAPLTPEAPPPEEDQPTPQPGITVTPPAEGEVDNTPYLYYTQSGDTLASLAVRFAVLSQEITSPDPIPPVGLLNAGQLLVIPRRLYNTTTNQSLMPDSEIVYSPSAIVFDIETYVNQAGGYLSGYSEYLGSAGINTGAEIITRVALENSINPRILLSLLEYQSGWVFNHPSDPKLLNYPLGYENAAYSGLYSQLMWAVDQLSNGYYWWREGLLTDIVFTDRVTARMAPDLNAGTASLYYFFTRLYDSAQWVNATNPQTGLAALHESMFGSAWVRADTVEPLFPPSLFQPEMILPFVREQMWSFSGGPHGAWSREGSRAALDFAPGSTEPGCVPSWFWVTASAPGLVVRSGDGVVVVDLDGDGLEQTGWALVYLHVATQGRLPVGEWVSTGDPIGHPSCEGGFSTGTHVHIARKYNGEWLAAGGPIPFNLSGWIASAGSQTYDGTLSRNGIDIHANSYGTFATRIMRGEDDPW